MCEFNYDLPFPQFDRRNVHGLIGTLFKVKECAEYGTAITQLLGGRVFNTVIVERSDVAV